MKQFYIKIQCISLMLSITLDIQEGYELPVALAQLVYHITSSHLITKILNLVKRYSIS